MHTLQHGITPPLFKFTKSTIYHATKSPHHHDQGWLYLPPESHTCYASQTIWITDQQGNLRHTMIICTSVHQQFSHNGHIFMYHQHHNMYHKFVCHHKFWSRIFWIQPFYLKLAKKPVVRTGKKGENILFAVSIAIYIKLWYINSSATPKDCNWVEYNLQIITRLDKYKRYNTPLRTISQLYKAL